MPVIGISAGRKNKVTESVVKAVLDGVNGDPTFVSLSGKLIRPCEACNGCVATNRCVLDDDFLWAADQIRESDALVFGAPNHFRHMNSKGLAFWERLCFSGRHNALFPLQGKPAAIVAIGGDRGAGKPVLEDLQRYFRDARLDLVGHVEAQGEYACFTCGYGNECAVGGFASLYPLGTEISDDNTPSIDNQHPHLPGSPCHHGSLRDEAIEMGKAIARVLACSDPG